MLSYLFAIKNHQNWLFGLNTEKVSRWFNVPPLRILRTVQNANFQLWKYFPAQSCQKVIWKFNSICCSISTIQTSTAPLFGTLVNPSARQVWCMWGPNKVLAYTSHASSVLLFCLFVFFAFKHLSLQSHQEAI